MAAVKAAIDTLQKTPAYMMASQRNQARMVTRETTRAQNAFQMNNDRFNRVVRWSRATSQALTGGPGSFYRNVGTKWAQRVTGAAGRTAARAGAAIAALGSPVTSPLNSWQRPLPRLSVHFSRLLALSRSLFRFHLSFGSSRTPNGSVKPRKPIRPTSTCRMIRPGSEETATRSEAWSSGTIGVQTVTDIRDSWARRCCLTMNKSA
jgi:hypothetical protein